MIQCRWGSHHLVDPRHHYLVKLINIQPVIPKPGNTLDLATVIDFAWERPYRESCTVAGEGPGTLRYVSVLLPQVYPIGFGARYACPSFPRAPSERIWDPH